MIWRLTYRLPERTDARPAAMVSGPHADIASAASARKPCPHRIAPMSSRGHPSLAGAGPCQGAALTRRGSRSPAPGQQGSCSSTGDQDDSVTRRLWRDDRAAGKFIPSQPLLARGGCTARAWQGRPTIRIWAMRSTMARRLHADCIAMARRLNGMRATAYSRYGAAWDRRHLAWEGPQAGKPRPADQTAEQRQRCRLVLQIYDGSA